MEFCFWCDLPFWNLMHVVMVAELMFLASRMMVVFPVALVALAVLIALASAFFWLHDCLILNLCSFWMPILLWSCTWILVEVTVALVWVVL